MFISTISNPLSEALRTSAIINVIAQLGEVDKNRSIVNTGKQQGLSAFESILTA